MTQPPHDLERRRYLFYPSDKRDKHTLNHLQRRRSYGQSGFCPGCKVGKPFGENACTVEREGPAWGQSFPLVGKQLRSDEGRQVRRNELNSRHVPSLLCWQLLAFAQGPGVAEQDPLLGAPGPE